jgi:DNA polymerase III delta subunit
MLVVFSGNNTVDTRAQAREYILREEELGKSARTISSDAYQVGELAAAAQGASLFGGVECIVLDTLSEHEEAFAELLEVVSLLASSPHTFVVIEKKLSAEDAKTFAAHAEKMVQSKDDAVARFNAFALADALATKDKKTLWMLLLRAQSEGLTPEEIIGTLFWQLKSLRLAKITKTAAEADMKDFPYNKAKRAAAKFTTEELQILSERLLTVYHKGHLGSDINLTLEQWVLTI